MHQCLANLTGYNQNSHVLSDHESAWIDQCNTLDRLHTVKKDRLKEALSFFFTTKMIDDEMIGSKAGDVEPKTIMDRKRAGEGAVCDVIQNLLFQLLLDGMTL